MDAFRYFNQVEPKEIQDSQSSRDHDFADRSSCLDKFVGGLHRFGAEPIQSGRRDWLHSTLSDESRDNFENAALFIRRAAVHDPAEDHLCVKGCGLHH